jgi:hypothetical protein
VRRRLDFDATSGRIGLLFMVGSACFAVASIPAVAEVVPGPVLGAIYFVGSLFFTPATRRLRGQLGDPDRRWLFFIGAFLLVEERDPGS